jgi:hypothetical protein
MKQQHILAALSAASLLAIAGSGVAAEEEQEDPWRFGVTAPIWAAALDGNVTLRGRTKDVNLSFDELKDHLDACFSLGLEARQERFGLFADVGYLKFSANADDIILKLVISDFGAGYRLLKLGEERPFILEGTAGLRYWYVGSDLTIRGRGGDVLARGDRIYRLYDPVVGLRGSQYLVQKLHVDFGADIGGFGISHDQSNLDWSAGGVLTYDFFKWFSLSGGYKALAIDIHRNSGDRKKGVDLTMHGLLLAATLKF